MTAAVQSPGCVQRRGAWLINRDEQWPMGSELVEQRLQLGFVVGQ
jgi:hypothetical protein